MPFSLASLCWRRVRCLISSASVVTSTEMPFFLNLLWRVRVPWDMFVRIVSGESVKSRTQVWAGLSSLDFLRPREERYFSEKTSVGSIRMKKQLLAFARDFREERACLRADFGEFFERAGP